jgi:hypothetical protein
MGVDLNGIVEQVVRWDGVSRHLHRFCGEEFRLGTAELGHFHPGGVVDIPFPVALRVRLVAAGHAEPHHVLPASGWTTVRLGRQGPETALQLLHLSYLRQRVRQARGMPDHEVLAREVAELEGRLLPQDGGEPLEGVGGSSLPEAGAKV